MPKNPQYYFDTLPLHSKPEHLESFTSYLSRLSEMNGIDSISALASICFPDYTLGSVRGLKDYFPGSFGRLPIVAVCPEKKLRKTTFFYLAEKFGRSPLPPPHSNFLSGNISGNLRYCPECLKERLYYILPWRFTLLSGCNAHCCRLLDKCGYCSRPVPIFSHTLRVGICPSCKGDLRLGQAEGLSDEESQKVFHFSQDLESLLLSQTPKTISSINASTIGQEFAFLRRERALTRIEASNQSGISNFQLKSMENEAPGTANVSFQYYLKYAAFLGVCITDVLNNLARSHMLPSAEDVLIQQVKEAANDLKLQNESVTQRAICKLVDLSKSSLNRFPYVKLQVAEEVRKTREERKQLHATKMFERIQNAIVHLETSSERITYHAISEITQIPSNTFKKYVEIRELLKQKVSHKRTSFQESELLANVEDAICQLEKRQVAVTQVAVSGIVNVDRQTLVSFPRIKAFLETKISQYHGLPSNIRNSHLFEEALLIKLKVSLPEIKALGQGVTLCAIGKILEVHPDRLKRYPRVWTILNQHLHLPSSQNYLSGDAVLLADVKVAIRHLEDHNLPVTYSSVGELLSTNPSKFRDYPQTRALLERYARQSNRYRVLQNQAREKELIVIVERAIEHFNSLRHPITMREISTYIEVSLHCLRTYPQAYKVLKQGVEAYRESTKAKILPLEELVIRVEEAKVAIRSRGESVTRQSISVTVGMSVTALMRYPLMRDILNPKKLREEAFFLRVEEAIRRLKTSGEVVTQEKLARELKMSPSTLCTHSEIKSLLRTIEMDKQKEQAERFARRENELILLVSMAVQQLHLNGQSISAKAIAKTIGMSPPMLKYYPKVKEVLENAIENRRNEQSL